jgi:hypothetical protein
MNRSVRRIAKVLTPLGVAVSLLVVPSGASAAIDVGKLKAWWPLSEGSGQKVNDLSGYGNHGTLGSTAGADDNDPSWIKGIFFGNALHFDGNDFIKVPASTALENPNFTVSLWTRAPESPGAFRYLISKGSMSCTAASWGVTTDGGGGLFFYVWDGHNFVRSGGAPTNVIWDGRWHNVSATYDGTSTVMYVDGVSMGAPPGSSSPIDYNLPDPTTTIGGYVGACDLLFKGDLDQVMVFDKVLPITEIWSKFGFILNKPTMG